LINNLDARTPCDLDDLSDVPKLALPTLSMSRTNKLDSLATKRSAADTSVRPICLIITS
jgi:hypothetical protein